MKTRRLLPLILVAVVACLATANSACTLFSDPGFIAYAVGEPGSRDIAVSMPDGTERRVITADAIGQSADDFAPVWSPDRQRIAFLSNRDGNVEVYLAIADGSRVVRLTNTGVDESQVTWSPDGNQIAYTSPDIDGTSLVYWLSLSDLMPTRLLFGSASESDPQWSPKGTWVAFASLDEQGEPIGLYLRNPSGVNRLQVTQSPDRSPAWSPDGKRLAFVSTRDGNEDIYVIEVRDNGPIGQANRVTDTPGRDFAPDWSPDGKRLAFLSDRNGNIDIFTASHRGEDINTLTRSPFDEIAVEWGPDGRVVFESAPTGKSELFVMDTSGIQHQITTDELPSSLPNW